ncbi:MAG TPA: hypothetical protein VMV18_08825 [bacterium]|nr:hypothetical protein [bacterium]
MSAAVISFTPTRTVHFTQAGLTLLDGGRAVLTFRPGARDIPRGGEEIVFAGPDGRYRLQVLAETSSRRNHSRYARAYVSFSPRRIVRVLGVDRCGTCHGSGAVEIPGPCPECHGRGCVDCDDTGRIDYSECPTCRGGQRSNG